MSQLLSLVLVVLLALASCSKQDDIDRAYTDYRYDIVTYMGQNDLGAVFDYLGRDDSADIKLQSRVTVSDVKAGQRVLLRYDFADQRTGAAERDISVYGCNAIVNDSLRLSAITRDSLTMHPVKLRSLWRTGEFINLHCQVEYTGKSRMFMLVADEATLALDTVDCYLVHDLRGERGTFWRDCYASFNVGTLWKRPSLHCLRLNIVDETFPETGYYCFTK
ncbi:MAG: hypothetical protein IJV05_05130 [Muribaculaceae bacterium]|nr:hypothetical protein [Muribaculaceae bacterium]